MHVTCLHVDFCPFKPLHFRHSDCDGKYKLPSQSHRGVQPLYTALWAQALVKRVLLPFFPPFVLASIFQIIFLVRVKNPCCFQAIGRSLRSFLVQFKVSLINFSIVTATNHFLLFWHHSADSPLLWIRIDPDMSILRKVEFEQADFMWQYQLKFERDVVAQEEAISALEKFPTPASRRALTDILEQDQCFYKVRMQACFCLAKVSQNNHLQLWWW